MRLPTNVLSIRRLFVDEDGVGVGAADVDAEAEPVGHGARRPGSVSGTLRPRPDP